MDRFVAGGPAAPGTLAMGAAPARLLLSDDAALHPQLLASMAMLAEVGRSHANGSAREDTENPTGKPMLRLVGPSGEKRSEYYLLVLHLHLAAFAARYEAMSPSIWAACEEHLPAAVDPARAVEAFTDVPPQPSQLAQVLWLTLCLAEFAVLAQRDVDLELVDSVVHHATVIDSDQPAPLHEQDVDTSIDTWTYRELVGLHALASLALLRRRRTWAKRVEQVARYHLDHTQPDFITSEPWGLFAFAWSDSTRTFADQQLSDVQAQAATTGSGEVGLAGALLLADAAGSFAQFQ